MTLPLTYIIKRSLNPLRQNSNDEIVDKINEMLQAIREIQNHINGVESK